MPLVLLLLQLLRLLFILLKRIADESCEIFSIFDTIFLFSGKMRSHGFVRLRFLYSKYDPFVVNRSRWRGTLLECRR